MTIREGDSEDYRGSQDIMDIYSESSRRRRCEIEEKKGVGVLKN